MCARVAYVCVRVRAPTRLTDSRLAPHRLGSLIIADEEGDSVKINRSARAIIIILIIIINVIIHPRAGAFILPPGVLDLHRGGGGGARSRSSVVLLGEFTSTPPATFSLTLPGGSSSSWENSAPAFTMNE